MGRRGSFPETEPAYPGGLMVKGVMLTGLKVGGPFSTGNEEPCATMEVPCGMLAMRATVVTSSGSVVAGTLIQRPGSMWIPASLPLGPLT